LFGDYLEVCYFFIDFFDIGGKVFAKLEDMLFYIELIVAISGLTVFW
jgi:hypothetical protein